MKKLTVSLSDSMYEKFCLEALEQKKTIAQVIRDRIYEKKFSEQVELAFEQHLQEEINRLTK